MRIGWGEMIWIPMTRKTYIPGMSVTIGRFSIAFYVRYVGGHWYRRFGKYPPTERLECFEIGEAMRADYRARQA